MESTRDIHHMINYGDDSVDYGIVPREAVE